MKYSKRYTENVEYIITFIKSKKLNLYKQESIEFKELLTKLCNEFNIKESYIRLVAGWKK